MVLAYPDCWAAPPSTGTAEISSVGAKPLVRSARFVLSTDSTPVGGGIPEHSYLTDHIPLDGGLSQAAEFQYLTPTTPKLPVQIVGSLGAIGRVLVPSH